MAQNWFILLGCKYIYLRKNNFCNFEILKKNMNPEKILSMQAKSKSTLPPNFVLLLFLCSDFAVIYAMPMTLEIENVSFGSKTDSFMPRVWKFIFHRKLQMIKKLFIVNFILLFPLLEYHDYSLQDGRPSRGSFYDQVIWKKSKSQYLYLGCDLQWFDSFY